jgi:hypothetical protein
MRAGRRRDRDIKRRILRDASLREVPQDEAKFFATRESLILRSRPPFETPPAAAPQDEKVCVAKDGPRAPDID